MATIMLAQDAPYGYNSDRILVPNTPPEVAVVLQSIAQKYARRICCEYNYQLFFYKYIHIFGFNFLACYAVAPNILLNSI